MAVTFLLDTAALSEPLKPAPNDEFMRKWELHQTSCAVASVAWFEAWYGCVRLPPSRRRSRIERYLVETIEPRVPVIEYDAASAIQHAEIRLALERSGISIPMADAQIAAIALTRNLTLVTLDRAHFGTIPGLRVENWSH